MLIDDGKPYDCDTYHKLRDIVEVGPQSMQRVGGCSLGLHSLTVPSEIEVAHASNVLLNRYCGLVMRD